MSNVYREVYDAIVTNNDDPDKLGRIRVRCEALADGELQTWVKPSFSHASPGAGFFVIPNKDDVVEIEFNSSDDPQETILRPDFRYRASSFRKAKDVPDEFRGSNYRKKYGIKLKSGAALVLGNDDSYAALNADEVYLGTLSEGQPAVVGDDYQSHLEDVIQKVIDFVDRVIDIINAVGSGGSYEVADPVSGTLPVSPSVATAASLLSAGIGLNTAKSSLNSLKSQVADNLSSVVFVEKDK